MKNSIVIIIFLSSLIVNAQRNPFKNITEKNNKIGIGTNNPDQMLTVKGTIHTQEVLVDLDGAVAPDYVFESYYLGNSQLNPNYKLLSLQDLELFLKENNHLPNVPSASEMENEGMNLKEMNLILLQKIEELTLYTLQQQKEIDGLKKLILNSGFRIQN